MAVATPTRTEQARARADEIRSRLDAMAEHVEAIPELIAQAWEDGDFEPLGYPTWEDYVQAEWGTRLLKLERVVRRDWVIRLTAKGLSTREIAPVVNTHRDTVANDLRGGNPPGRSTSPDGRYIPAADIERAEQDFRAQVEAGGPIDGYTPEKALRDYEGTFRRVISSMAFLASTAEQRADIRASLIREIERVFA